MRHFRLIFMFIIAMGCCPDGLVNAATRLEARLVDDATGQPLAARVAVTNPEGKSIEIEGPHPHVQYLDKHWCYVDGTFSLAMPESGIQVEIRRGFETRPIAADISTDKASPVIQKTFRLRRWIDLRQKGLYNGDIHAHLPVPQEAHFQMRAEDLNALTLLHVADPVLAIATNAFFTGQVDEHSTPGHEIYVGQEVQDWQMGHLTLLGLTRLIPGYPNAGGSLEYWKSMPNWDLVPAMRAARAQNGIVFWSHFCSLPGAQSPIGVALGLVDGIELITWNDPTQLPNHWSPWQNSGMSQAEFPVMRPLDLYYQYLNAGFCLPIGAGTDKLAEDIPLGSNRTYARTKSPGHYADWLAAVRAGNGFVSNGPILEFSVEGKEPGDVVEFHGSNRIKARATARSILPFTTLEIVMNGETIGHKTLPIPRNPAVDGIFSMEVGADVELNQSSWIAARVVDHPDLRNRILPRGLSVFAHTNPVYFLQDGRKVRQAASIAYLCKYVEGVRHWLSTHPAFAREADRENAEQEAIEAFKVYQGL